MVLILSLRLQGSKRLVQPVTYRPSSEADTRCSGLENKPKQETKRMESGQLDRIRCGSRTLFALLLALPGMHIDQISS